MGWTSATEYFDVVAKAADEVLGEFKTAQKHELLLRILRPLAEELDKGDWDAHQESEYWGEFKWDLWPEEAEQEQKDLLEDA
jgi:hypothetical protein